MKRRNTVSLLFTVSIVLASMVSFVSTASAQQGGRQPVADTGMLGLGPNEELRLSVVPKDGASNISVRFRLTKYTGEVCNGPVCKHVATSQTTSAPVMVDAGEAASFKTTAEGELVHYFRAVVLSSSPNVRVTAIVFDTSTQRVLSICTFIPD